MMRMVLVFAGNFFHGKIAGERSLAGADERITEWARHIFEVVFRKKFPIHFHAQTIGQLGDANLRGRAGGRQKKQDRRENKKSK